MTFRSVFKFARAAMKSGTQARPQRQKTSAMGEIWPTARRPATELPPHIKAVRPRSSIGEFQRRSRGEGRARVSALVIGRNLSFRRAAAFGLGAYPLSAYSLSG